MNLDQYSDEELGRMLKQAAKSNFLAQNDKVLTFDAFCSWLNLVGLGYIGDIIKVGSWTWDRIKSIVSKLFDKNVSVHIEVVFSNIWIEPNVYSGEEFGFNIHTTFTIYGMQNRLCSLNIWFCHPDGRMLVDINGQYSTPDGQVGVASYLNLPYEITYYEDFAVFFPIRELHLGPGKHNLMFFMGVSNESQPIGNYSSYTEILID